MNDKAKQDFLTMWPTFESKGDSLREVYDTPEAFVVFYQERDDDNAYAVLIVFKNGTSVRVMGSPSFTRAQAYAQDIALSTPSMMQWITPKVDVKLLTKLYEASGSYVERRVVQLVEKKYAFIVVVQRGAVKLLEVRKGELRHIESPEFVVEKCYKDGDVIQIGLAHSEEGAEALVRKCLQPPAGPNLYSS